MPRSEGACVLRQIIAPEFDSAQMRYGTDLTGLGDLITAIYQVNLPLAQDITERVHDILTTRPDAAAKNCCSAE